jgi:hypothetical protein
MGVQSGSHLRYKPDPQKPLDYALVDLLLTRGEGIVNENGFAGQIEWGVPDQGLQDYVVQKLKHLTLTEHGTVKASACKLLWIYTVDRISPEIQQDAAHGLHDADCRYATRPDGNVECQ